MPRLSYLFIRASLVYLVLGSTFGSLILANKGIPFAPFIWTLLPIHIEFLILGWLTQLALGVAYWILPRLTSSTPRGDERWSRAAFVLVNLGIALNIAAPYAGFFWLGLLARVLQAVGVAAFAIGNWQRIYPLKFSFQARQ
jgi:hypothetical protein